jgi:hypothetical protein
MTTQDKTELLYKKFLGTPAGNPGIAYVGELGSARTNLFAQTQLYSQPIPQIAPESADFIVSGYVTLVGGKTTIVQTEPSSGNLGTIKTSKSYPWLQKIEYLQLQQATPFSYYFNNPVSSINLLQNIIPFNYDLGGSYNYALYKSGSDPLTQASLLPSNPPNWFIDSDAGYLYFPTSPNDWKTYFSTLLPLISFYRYNGTMGIPTNLGNFAGAYAQDPTAIAIGNNAGYTGQGANALAIGNFAGVYGQGTGSIAIGYLAGPTGMSTNSIVLNASGKALAGTGPTGGFYVAPIASYSGSTGPFKMLAYGADNQIVTMEGTSSLNLPSSTQSLTYDSWLANIIDAPPAVSLNIDKTTTTDVYITFSYPSQIHSGLSQSGLLPYINNIFVNLYKSGDVQTILNGVTGSTGLQSNTSDFIAQKTPVEPGDVVQCINLTKSASKPIGLGEPYTTTTTPTKTLKSYTIPYTSLTASQEAYFYLWYANNNPNKNVSFTKFKYIDAQNPTQVTTLTITPSATSQSITITFTGSSAIDSGDSFSTASVNYAIVYKSIDGSNTRRYLGTKSTGNVNGQLIGPIGTAGGAQSQTITSLIYPDTSYFVTVNASNTSLGLGSFTGTTGTSIQSSTGPAPPEPQTNSSPVLPSSILLSAKPVYGGPTVSNLLKTTTSALPSLTTSFNIHNSYESRGYTGPNPLVNFTTNLSGPVGIIGPSASIYGFSETYNYPSISQNGINLSFTSPVDIGSETDGTNGYYLKTDATMSITNASNIVASSSQYTMCVTGAYSSGNGAPASSATTFYYDGEISTPSISTSPVISVNNNNLQTTPICGINVVTSMSFDINTTNVDGIGRYFYNKDGIISYVPSGPIGLTFTPPGETDLSKLASGTGPNGFNTPISFGNTISLSGIASFQYYAGPVGVSVKPYNLNNVAGNAVLSNTFPLIFDPVSISNKSAFRVCSVNSGNETVSYNSVSSSGSRNDVSAYVTGFPEYNDSIPYTTIDTNLSSYKKEALYTNGVYVSSGSRFTNYGDFLYNTGLNYSNINAGVTFRYITYKFPILKTVGPFNTITFTLTGLTNSNKNNNSIYHGNDQSTRLLFFYRFEDSTSLATKTNWETGGQISTPWIDGNYVASSSNAPTGASAPTSANANSVYFTPCGGVSDNTPNNLVVKLPYTINSTGNTQSDNMSLYCRVGLSTLYSTSFNDITYTLSSS